MDAKLSAMYESDVKGGLVDIAQEKLMRAMLLHVLSSARSERQLVEQISYNLLFAVRWFVGVLIEDTVWAPMWPGCRLTTTLLSSLFAKLRSLDCAASPREPSRQQFIEHAIHSRYKPAWLAVFCCFDPACTSLTAPTA